MKWHQEPRPNLLERKLVRELQGILDYHFIAPIALTFVCRYYKNKTCNVQLGFQHLHEWEEDHSIFKGVESYNFVIIGIGKLLSVNH
jgi:hypothetical protein